MKSQSLKLRYTFLLLFSLLSSGSFSQSKTGLRYFMQSSSTPASAIPYGNNPQAGRFLTIGDAKIYYEVYGKGKPVVVLHGGIVGSSYEMGIFIDSLSKRYQVISVSTRGHGKSTMGTSTPSYERKAEDVNAIIKAVTTDSVTLLGFSDGAYTGYFLAARHPDKVKKLVAIGAGEWKQGHRKFNNTRKLLFSMDSLYFKQQLSLMPEPQRFDEWLASQNKYFNSVQIGKETLGSIKCPVLIMAGEKDQNAPLETILAAYRIVPKAQLSIIPNTPHPVFLVNFPAVWSSIIPFIQ
ncbi:MAG TPA: alpha/beta hydrolase [Daejeonella sp.]